jgi:hypothetical protein
MVRKGNGIKGFQKRMIVLKTVESRYFDEAYFLIRREAEPQETVSDDMLTEANRILCGCLSGPAEKKPEKGGLERLWIFLLGLICGVCVGLLAFFLTHR